jgi:hypothetical protein
MMTAARLHYPDHRVVLSGAKHWILRFAQNDGVRLEGPAAQEDSYRTPFQAGENGYGHGHRK